jgi:hypothetical protein
MLRMLPPQLRLLRQVQLVLPEPRLVFKLGLD